MLSIPAQLHAADCESWRLCEPVSPLCGYKTPFSHLFPFPVLQLCQWWSKSHFRPCCSCFLPKVFNAKGTVLLLETCSLKQMARAWLGCTVQQLLEHMWLIFFSNYVSPSCSSFGWKKVFFVCLLDVFLRDLSSFIEFGHICNLKHIWCSSLFLSLPSWSFHREMALLWLVFLQNDFALECFQAFCCKKSES